MEEVLECNECGKVFSIEETLEKHAQRIHGTGRIEKDKGLFSL
jgi:uncharacterized C2H2 Zn-finger protein